MVLTYAMNYARLKHHQQNLLIQIVLSFANILYQRIVLVSVDIRHKMEKNLSSNEGPIYKQI